jgi:hypothetical protein
MSAVVVSDYAGVLLPCMAGGSSRNVPRDAVRNVRDGNIVTSGVCPMQAMERRRPDGTEELMRQFIEMVVGR